MQQKKTIKDPAPALINEDAERALLGRILNDDAFFTEVEMRVAPEAFQVPGHAAIFRAISALVHSGVMVSVETLAGQIGDVPEFGVASSAYLAGLLVGARDEKVLYEPIEDLILAVGHPHSRRRIVEIADWIKEQAQTATITTSLENLKAEAQKKFSFNDGLTFQDGMGIGHVIEGVVARIGVAQKAGVRIGIETGFRPFDFLVGSLLPGQLLVVAGETSSGKTALVVQLGQMVAESGHHVYLSSLEMTKEDIGTRMLTRATGYSSEKIMSANLTDIEIDSLMTIGQTFHNLNMLVDDMPRQSVTMIQAKLSRSKAINNTKLAIIDHLQYIKHETASRDEREQIRQVVDDVKACAKRLEMPIILVSHISRPQEYRQINRASDIKKPSLNSLYGSSAIEKAADSVVFVHRPHWYLSRSNPMPDYAHDHANDLYRWEGRAILCLQKRRMGQGSAEVECYFDEETTWFSPIDAYGGAI